MRIALFAALALSTASAPAAVIETGAYGPGPHGNAGALALTPGSYRFDFVFSQPVALFEGAVQEQITTIDYCRDPDVGPDPFVCSSNSITIEPLFEPLSPTRYEALLTIESDRILSHPPGSFLVRSEVFVDCCTYRYSFEAETPGTFAFNVTRVPEPAVWAMMLAGFALAGTTRRRVASSAAFG